MCIRRHIHAEVHSTASTQQQQQQSFVLKDILPNVPNLLVSNVGFVTVTRNYLHPLTTPFCTPFCNEISRLVGKSWFLSSILPFFLIVFILDSVYFSSHIIGDYASLAVTLLGALNVVIYALLGQLLISDNFLRIELISVFVAVI